MKHKKSIQVLLTLLTLPYIKDINSIILESFIEQLKGAQINANDLPHPPEVPAADAHEDHRSLPQVLEAKGHRFRTWSQLQYCFAYPKGSYFPKNHQLHDERQPAEVHDAILSAEVVGFSTIFLLRSPYSKSQGLQKFHS